MYVGHQAQNIPLYTMGRPRVKNLDIGTFFIPMSRFSSLRSLSGGFFIPELRI
jgi:hypothetical protein